MASLITVADRLKFVRIHILALSVERGGGGFAWLKQIGSTCKCDNGITPQEATQADLNDCTLQGRDLSNALNLQQWDICELKDGEIKGPYMQGDTARAGTIQDKTQGGYGCVICRCQPVHKMLCCAKQSLV